MKECHNYFIITAGWGGGYCLPRIWIRFKQSLENRRVSAVNLGPPHFFFLLPPPTAIYWCDRFSEWVHVL